MSKSPDSTLSGIPAVGAEVNPHPSSDLVSRLRDLVVSREPAVIFSSLAELCVPGFSDACTAEINEGGGAEYRAIDGLLVCILMGCAPLPLEESDLGGPRLARTLVGALRAGHITGTGRPQYVLKVCTEFG